MERLADVLLEREVLTATEIEELIGKRAAHAVESDGDEVVASLDNPS
jgi:cell division protease FtsH